MNVLECFWHKSGVICPLMIFEVILHLMENLHLHNVDILEIIVFKRLGIKQKDNFEILR